MKPRDEIAKSVKMLFDSTKDVVLRAVMDAARGPVKLETKQLEFLITLIDRTLDDGFHQGNNSFMKEVDKSLDEVAAEGVTSRQSKKK